MLRQIRGTMKNAVVAFFSVVIVLSFALWGVPELRSFTQKAPLRVGKIGFSQQQILNEFNREMDERRRDGDGQYTREQALAEKLPDSVVSSLATKSILEQEAAKMGLAMPRSLVTDILHSDERFQNPGTGKFDEMTLQNILASNGLTVRQFEALMKEDLLRAQLVGALTAGTPAPLAMTKALVAREVERRRVAYLTITDEMAGTPASPTQEQLKAYYDANVAAFMAPEYRTFAVVTVRLEDFQGAVAAPEEELRRLYDANRERLYEQPERRTLYQLTYEDEAAADAAAATLRQGTPFENVAAERGLTLAQATFTEIGKKDTLDPAVGDAAFASDVAAGAVVGPIKTIFGFTVAQVAAVIPPQSKSFEEVRDEIAGEMGKQEARKKLNEKVDELEDARDTGADLASAAAQLGLAVQRFGPVDPYSFAPGGAIIADIPGEVLAMAFKVQEGEESEATQLPDDAGYYFVQVEEATPPAPMPFDAVVNDVETRWRAEERKTRIEGTVKEMKDAIAKGSTLDAQAARFNRAALETVLGRRTELDAFSPALKEEIFKAAPGTLLDGEAASASAHTIAVVREIGHAWNEAGPEQAESYRPFLGYQVTQEHIDAYLAALREDYNVRTDQAAVAQLFADSQ